MSKRPVPAEHFVVHDKVLDSAVLYLDYLGILSAYIYNGKGVAFEQPGRASSMARDLCNSLMGKGMDTRP